MQKNLKTWQWADSDRLKALISEGGEELTDTVTTSLELAEDLKDHLENEGEMPEDDNPKVNQLLQDRADFYENGGEMDDFEKEAFYHDVAISIANIISEGRFSFGDLTIATQLIHDANNAKSTPGAQVIGVPKI